jgi:hypothetical protein
VSAGAAAPASAPAPASPPAELSLASPTMAAGGAPLSGAKTPDGEPAPLVLGEILIAPSARLIADVNALGRKLPMHLGDLVVDALAKMAAEKGFPVEPDLLAALATDRPVALILAQIPHGRSFQCLAIPVARPDAAAAVAAKLGAPIAQRGGAVERRHSSGTKVWVGVKDATVLVSRTYEGLWSAGARTLAASRAAVPVEDAVATLDLDVAVTAMGMTWEQVFAKAGADLAATNDAKTLGAAQGATKPKKPAAPHPAKSHETLAMMRIIGQELGQALSQSARVRLGISASAGDGLALRVALEPKPGTAMARRASSGGSYALDPGLVIRDDRTSVVAWSSLGLFAPLLRAQLEPAPPRAGAAAGASPPGSPLDGFLATFTGAGSCTFELGDSPPSSVCSLPLRGGADARTALEPLAALLRAMGPRAAAGKDDRVVRRVSTRIKKGVLEIDWPIDTRALTAQQVATVRSYLGGDSAKYAAAVRGGRLLQFQGAAPRARLTAWTEPPVGPAAAPRPAIVEEVLAHTRGSSFVMLFDPLALLLKVLAQAQDPNSRQAAIMLGALPGLATTRAPIVISAPAGHDFACELRVPIVAFDNIATLVGPFMGLMGK